MNRLTTILKSKTVWGAVLTSAAWLYGQPHVGVVEVVQAAGPVLAAAGVRDAFTKYLAPQ